MPTLRGTLFLASTRRKGGIFLRAAGMITDVMGWCREGEKEGNWEY